MRGRQKMCSNCGDSSRWKDFQDDYDKSILCKECFYKLFKDLIPGLLPPEIQNNSETEFNYNIVDESSRWKKKKKKNALLHLSGKWAEIFMVSAEDEQSIILKHLERTNDWKRNWKNFKNPPL